jgi:vacuolar protein-sorting-associated protein 4
MEEYLSHAEKLKECLSPFEEKRGRAAVGIDGSDSDIGSGGQK